MRLVFWTGHYRREKELVKAFADGAAVNGDKFEAIPKEDKPRLVKCDVACMVGVKSVDYFRLYRDAGVPVLYFDKAVLRLRSKDMARGNLRGVWTWRIAINEHNPTAYVETSRHNPRRWESYGIELKPWRRQGRHIIVAGSSEKYHEFKGLEHPTTYAQRIVRELRRYTDRPILYRPKPGRRAAAQIPDTEFAGDRYLEPYLEGAHALVTHGSNACCDALVDGVPSIILGDAVIRSISSTELSSIEGPKMATQEARLQVLANLAWCQFTLDEMERGKAWKHLRPMVKAAA